MLKACDQAPLRRMLICSLTVSESRGNMKSGQICNKGCRTNNLCVARGCGKMSCSDSMLCSPKLIRSKSMIRASLRTPFRLRPKLVSTLCKASSNSTGETPFSGHKTATAFANGGLPGGQSTGSVTTVSETSNGEVDSSCKAGNTAFRLSCGLPFGPDRLEPRAMTASGTTRRCGLYRYRSAMVFSRILMHRIHKGADICRVNIRRDAMTQVKHMTTASTIRCKNSSHLGTNTVRC